MPASPLAVSPLLLAVLTLQAPARIAAAPPSVAGPYLRDPGPDGVTVAWETEPAAEGDLVVAGVAGERRFASPAARHHEVRVPALDGRSHAYAIVSGGGVVASGVLPAPARDGLTFLVYGDTRDGDVEHAHIVEAMAAEGADLAIHAG